MMLSRCKILARHLKLESFRAEKLLKYSTRVINSQFGDVEIPSTTLTEFVWSKSDAWKNLPAMSCGLTGRSFTYEISRSLCVTAAKALLSQTKLRPGDRLALYLPNIPEYLMAVHSGLLAGLVITFANPLYTADELTRQFKNAGVRCIITIPQLMETAQKVAVQLDNYDCTISVGGKSDPGQKVIGLESLLTKTYDVKLPEVSPKDLAVLPYSSGTTGLPKGVMLSHENLVVNIVQYSNPQITEYIIPDDTRQDKVLTVLPFFHIYGFNVILNYLTYVGVHIVTLPRFSPEEYIACLVKHRPTVLFVVPSLMLFLATHPQVTADHLRTIRKIYSGAAPVKKSVCDKFIEKLARDDCCINQGYGMTETSPVVTLTPPDTPYSKAGTVGKLVPGTKARVVDISTGQDVDGNNKPGELWVHGPQIMQGYLNNPAATRETVDQEGWLHTGDVAYYDEEEYFYIVDRTKELIKVKGNQVSPTELESLILEIPGIADVAVIGVPDTVAGELPKAFIVKKQGSEVDEQFIHNYVNPKVASFKKLAGGISFIEAVPRNPSGKIMRNELK